MKNTKPTWLEVVNNPLKKGNSENLSLLVHSIMDQLMNEGPEIVNNFLKEVDVENVKPSLLVAIMSSSFSWRYSMPEWFLLRERIVVELKKYNFDVEKNLKGLLN